jgi:hypothetical protein
MDHGNLPGDEDEAAWRPILIQYYQNNAPERVDKVNDKMMETFFGRYSTLYDKMIAKFGPPVGSTAAEPEDFMAKPSNRARPPNKPPARRLGTKPKGLSSNKASSDKSIAGNHDTFVALVEQHRARNAKAAAGAKSGSSLSRVDAKQLNSENGLETSTFTVCTRMRPLLAHEIEARGDCFSVCVPGRVSEKSGCEELLLLTPKFSMTGEPKLESKAFKFDHVFGPEKDNTDVFGAIGAPLAARAMRGEVGVVFAFGQTGSGKTYTMNGVMDQLVNELFNSPESQDRTITFSYMEMLGPVMLDCLAGVAGIGGKCVCDCSCGCMSLRVSDESD